LRKDKAAALHEAEILLQSSVRALVDGSTTEMCDDWWAPESPDATAVLTVEPAAPVGELWILSSRGGVYNQEHDLTSGVLKRDRGTTRVRISLTTASGAKTDLIVRLNNYPNWTVVAPSVSEPVAKIEIRSLDFVGQGPALAGVKAFKTGW